MIEAGNVYLPAPDEQPWIEDTLLEFCTFPAAKHDDRVDAASQALLWLQAKRGVLDRAFLRSIGAANAELTEGSYYHGGDRLPSEYPEGGSSLRVPQRWSM